MMGRLAVFVMYALQICLIWRYVSAFSIISSNSHGRSVSKLSAASSRGMGMGGGAVKTKSKASKKKKNRGKGSNSNKRINTVPFDVGASLLRLEKKYDGLLLDAAKRLQKEEDEYDIVTTEYIIAARDKTAKVIADWVPVAQLCLARTWRNAHASEGSSDYFVKAALSFYCREISHVAGLGSRVFPSVPRHDLEYSVETLDSFHKFVYEAVVETSSSSGQHDSSMTKKEARAVLQITEDEDCSLRDIKSKYRRRSFELHPDRMVSQNDFTDAERQAAAEDYSKVKNAYNILSQSGWEGSYYESLGGRERTDFIGPVELLPIALAEAELASCQSALVGLDPDMVQSFVARSLGSSRK